MTAILGSELFEEALQLASEALSRPFADDLSDLGLVAAHHLAAAERDARAVKVMCDNDLSDVALIVLRRIWECMIRLEYIRKKPDERARAFIEEAWVDAMRTVNASQRGVSSGSAVAMAIAQDPRFEAKLKELESLSSRVSDKALERVASQRLKPLWSLGQMAAEIGLQDQYDFLYHFLSQRTHAGVDAAKDFFRVDESARLHLNKTDHSKMALGLACTWLLFIASVFAEIAGHGDLEKRTETAFNQLKKSPTPYED